MRRIGLAIIVTVSLLLVPFAAEAQPATKVWRIGYLTPAELPPAPLIEALRQLGYVDGGGESARHHRGEANDFHHSYCHGGLGR